MREAEQGRHSDCWLLVQGLWVKATRVMQLPLRTYVGYLCTLRESSEWLEDEWMLQIAAERLDRSRAGFT